MSYAKPTSVGGRFWSPRTALLAVIAAIGLGLIAWRFAVGLGASTGLNDGYPWGIWIAFDVVSGTALACGGYAVALMVYIFNKGKYHPLVRPALLTSALGYSVAAVGIVIDVGRPWLIYRIPISFGKWNLDSALLEVALCVMAYLVVLWIELSPAFLEKWSESSNQGWAKFAGGLGAFMEKSLIWIIALGIVLPTMHQSSLGTVIMLAGPRLHGLWHTGWLPFLFLVSCIAMGYAVVVMESTLSSRAFGREREDKMLGSLSGMISGLLFFFVLFRLGDIIIAGKTDLLLKSGMLSVLFWIETALFLLPAIGLASGKGKSSPGCLFRMAFMLIMGGILYRFDAYMVAFNPGPGWSYFPSIPETVITLGLVALEILVFILLVRNFPILGGTRTVSAEGK